VGAAFLSVDTHPAQENLVMNPLSRDAVVDQLTSQLAERRGRRSAYLALARAILSEDFDQRLAPTAFDAADAARAA